MHDRKRKRKLTIRLGGVAEVADALGITKSTLADRRHNFDFPKPVAELAATPVWDMAEIDEYKERREADPFAAYRWENQPSRWDEQLRRPPRRRSW